MAPVVRTLLACAVAALVIPAGALAAPVVSIFYYPWYGNPAHDGQWVHWLQNGHSPPADIAANFYPTRGAYSSSDPSMIRAEMGEMKAAGINEVVVSWWGRNSTEDQLLPAIIAEAKRNKLTVAAHLEPYSSRTAASVVADINYLRSHGITRYYVFQAVDIPSADWAAANDSLTGVQVFAQTALVGTAAAGHFDGIYTYDILTYGGDKFARLCAQARKQNLMCLPSVGPGFDARRATGNPRIKPRRNGVTYDTMWRAAIAARPDGVTITSYNEWHEGTQIEPASARPGSLYLTYDGAWGKHGTAATKAYLTRTASWAKKFFAALGSLPSK